MASGMAGKSFNQANFPGGRPSIGNADANGAPLIPNKSILQLPAQPQVGGDSIANAIQSGAGAAPMAGSSIAGAIQQGAQVAPVQQMAPQQAMYSTPAAPTGYDALATLGQSVSDIGQEYASVPHGTTPYGEAPGDAAPQWPGQVVSAEDARRAEIERRVNEQINEQQRQANRRAGALGLQGGLAQQGAASIAQKGAAELAGQLSAFDLEQQQLEQARRERAEDVAFREMVYEDLETQRITADKQALQDLWSDYMETLGKMRVDLEEVWGISEGEVETFIQRMVNEGLTPQDAMQQMNQDQTTATTAEQATYAAADSSTADLGQAKKDALPYGDSMPISENGAGNKAYFRDPVWGDYRMYEWNAVTKGWDFAGKGNQSDFDDWWE